MNILMLINMIISVVCGFSFSQVNDPNQTFNNRNETHSHEPADNSPFLISNLQSFSSGFDLFDGIALVAALFLTSGNLGLSSRNTNHHIF